MANKRSRTDFETDSPYVIYGTPLPTLDSDVRDDGSYVPLWKQEAVDERGRKRFHGAFTGGFSAGYFNTVGSKEGWSPATFVSSRKNRAKDQKPHGQQTAHDFMDDEDLADQEQSRQLQTNDSFAGLGSTADDARRRDALVDLIRPSTSFGMQLLQKMGWREGQGIGAKRLRKVQLDGNSKTHATAPAPTKMIAFVKKTDQRGLGFDARSGAHKSSDISEQADQPEDDFALSRSRFVKTAKSSKTGMGVGILNDNGSDDEDPYENGPKISYNRSIGPVKKPKKATKNGGLVISANWNPLLSSRPVFVKKKMPYSNGGLSKCHDGHLPLDGFLLASNAYNPSFNAQHAPPQVPPDWKSSRQPISDEHKDAESTPHSSTADAAREAKLDPRSRAQLLGEAQLPGKSVFDYMSSAARDRLAAATGKVNLPQAGNEPAPAEYQKPNTTNQQWQFVPALDSTLAKAALARANAPGGGFMPYADNTAKRARYRTFLELHAGIHTSLPARPPSASNDEWAAEMREFAQAAQVFRPMSGLMASRFTSSAASATTTDQPTLLTRPAARPVDPAVQAAQLAMYGPLTRSVGSWMPAKLLCKRFGVRTPASVEVEEEAPREARFGAGGASGAAKSQGMPVMLALPAAPAPSPSAATVDDTGVTQRPANLVVAAQSREVDAERNDALEGNRPADDVFKAIFGSDDDSD